MTSASTTKKLWALAQFASSEPTAGLRPAAARCGASAAGGDRCLHRGSAENYAREPLELHTPGVDGGYTEDDEVTVARAFTGWTIDLRSGRLTIRPELHDASPKAVLGQEIAVMGITEGEFVLELLAQLPLTEVFAEALAGQLGIS